MTTPGRDLYDWLQHARHHPAMFVRGHSLAELELLCRGYEAALCRHEIEEFGTGFHARFGEYLADRFDWSLACGWANAIRRTEVSDEAAFARFFDLLDEFAHTV